MAGAGAEPKMRTGRPEKECAWADVIVLGPGLGQEPYARLLVQSVLTSAYVPIVLDADGLNAVAAWPRLEQYYTENIVITPHLGEMARLTGKSVAQIQGAVVDTAMEYSSLHGIVCVLKDAATAVANREGMFWPGRWQGCWPRAWSHLTGRRWGCISTGWPGICIERDVERMAWWQGSWRMRSGEL